MKARAIDVYAWLARDKKALGSLGKMIKDPSLADDLWFSAVIAYGRIATTRIEAQFLSGVLGKYQRRFDLADNKLKRKASRNRRSRIEADKRRHEQRRNALHQSVVRIEIATRCKRDPSCYAATLDASDLAPGEPGLLRVERAMLELYQMGDRGKSATDKLLEHAGSGARLVREGINLALPRIAAKPCEKCAQVLAGILHAQRNQVSMDALNLDTRVLLHYFLWAGK